MISTVLNHRSVTRISISILLLTWYFVSCVGALAISLHEFFIVARSFARFHTFIIVTNYIDISRKMNYNRNRQFGRLEL